MLNRLRIGAKLGLGFGFVLLLMLGMGGYSARSITTFINHSEEMYNNYTVPLSRIGEISARFENNRYDIAMLTMATDPEVRLRLLDEMEKNTDRVTELLAAYEPSIILDEDRKAFHEVNAAREAYLPILKQLKDLVSAGKLDDARRLATDLDFEKAGDRMDNAVSALRDFNQEEARKIALKTSVLGTSTLTATWSMVCVALIAGALIAFVLSRAVVAATRKVLVVSQAVSNGDLTRRVEVAGADELADLGINFNRMMEDLTGLIRQIRSSAEQMSSGSQQISDASQTLSQGAAEQASSVEEITSSMEEIGTQTKQNAENATQANNLASVARESAQRGDQQMKQMVTAMDEINSSSQSIARIIKVIDEIAFQTNLLALNAAVEAARAGSHGKGFAVVAEEVRNLAARSAMAAKETTDMIETSVGKVRQGTTIASHTAQALSEIVGGISKVSDLVAEIAAASNEQAQGVNQVNQGLAQISHVTQQNTANAEETAAQSEELAGQAEQLQSMVMKFRLDELGAAPTVPPVPGAPVPRETAQPHAAGPRRPSDIIALDDSEFGRY